MSYLGLYRIKKNPMLNNFDFNQKLFHIHFTVFVPVGICCGGQLNGRTHWETSEAEWLWGSRDSVSGPSRKSHSSWESGCSSVRVDGQLPSGMRAALNYWLLLYSLQYSRTKINWISQNIYYVCWVDKQSFYFHFNCNITLLYLSLFYHCLSVWVHVGVSVAGTWSLAEGGWNDVAVLCLSDRRSLPGLLWLRAKNGVLGETLWPRLQLPTVRPFILFFLTYV